MKTFKQALRAAKNDRGNVFQKLSPFLMMYRNTPHATTGVSPAELFLKRRARTRLDVMRPASSDHVYEEQMEQKGNHDKRCRPREFQVGQAVWVRNVKDGPMWLPGEVCAKTGSVSYEVCVAGQVWKRHADQMVSQTGTQLSFLDEATHIDLDISVLLPVESPTLSPEIAIPTANELERVSQETSDQLTAIEAIPSGSGSCNHSSSLESEAQPSELEQRRSSPTTLKMYPRQNHRPCVRYGL